VGRTVEYLAGSMHEGGGWRCSFSKFGRGPETECSNPGATLYVLDVLRHFEEFREGSSIADPAVESLLNHWVTRTPTGPCHWGIGTQFLQIEYPFLRYNIFYFVYILSFFPLARNDTRFQQAFAALCSKLDEEGRIVVERPHRSLGKLNFCAKGRGSDAATRRLIEIQNNLM